MVVWLLIELIRGKLVKRACEPVIETNGCPNLALHSDYFTLLPPVFFLAQRKISYYAHGH